MRASCITRGFPALLSHDTQGVPQPGSKEARPAVRLGKGTEVMPRERIYRDGGVGRLAHVVRPLVATGRSRVEMPSALGGAQRRVDLFSAAAPDERMPVGR